MKTILALALVLTASECATTSYPTYNLTSRFEENEVAWFNEKGSATIKGEAFLRTRGGDIKTCAGSDVDIFPASTYATERVMALYGSSLKGYNGARKNYIFVPDTLAYKETTKTRICNAQGQFTFNDLPSGEYYVTTLVYWEVPSRYGDATQGGYLMQRVTVTKGEGKSLIMTNN